MKSISCRDMGMDCPWVGKGETLEDLAKQVKDHHMAEHPEYYEDTMKNMSDDEIMDMIEPYVKEE